MITGESSPVAKAVGDRVVAGTVSTDSSIRVRVDAVGDDTALAGIQRLVADAQASRSRAQVLADRFAALLFYVATGAAVVTFVVWCVARRPRRRRRAHRHRAGHRLPARARAGDPARRSRSRRPWPRRHGILVKDRLALERMRTVDAVLFDKTGTLTKGAHVVTGVAGAGGSTRTRCCASPPPSRPTASTRSPGRSSPPPASAATSRRRPGSGRSPAAASRPIVDGVRYAVGGPALLRERRLDRARPSCADRSSSGAARGAAVLYLVRRRRRSSARSRSRTRSAPRPARPSTSCSAHGRRRWR